MFCGTESLGRLVLTCHAGQNVRPHFAQNHKEKERARVNVLGHSFNIVARTVTPGHHAESMHVH